MKKKEREFSEDKIYYLADIKKKIYDPTPIKGWTRAVNANMMLQMYDDEKGFSVIPLEMKYIRKHKYKKQKLI